MVFGKLMSKPDRSKATCPQGAAGIKSARNQTACPAEASAEVGRQFGNRTRCQLSALQLDIN